MPEPGRDLVLLDTRQTEGGGDYGGGENMTLPFAGYPTGAGTTAGPSLAAVKK
jgi:hypothetical protein